MTVPVYINHSGPFAFVVDCGAEASVISESLADRLGLAPAGRLLMHSLAGPEPVTIVRAGTFSSGALNREDARLIRGLSGPMGGIDGLLGSDLLGAHRLVFRFGDINSIDVENSVREWIWPLSGRRRMTLETPMSRARGGLLTFPLKIGGIPTTVILDTGAMTSVINSALARASGAEALPPGLLSRNYVSSPTGATVSVAPYRLPTVKLGGIVLRNKVVVAADLHTFAVLGLSDRPVMLLAMDVLRRFRTVVIDPHRRELILEH